MSRHERSGRSSLNHERCQELLPWYDNDTLDRAELEAVEEHLDGCGECRSELASLRELRGSLRQTVVDDATVAGSFEDVLARIDSPQPSRRRASLPVRIALVAQAAAIIALVGLLIVQDRRAVPVEPGFHTLSGPEKATAGPASLRIVFDEGATELRIRQALRDAGAEIAGGPSENGVYTLRVDPGRDLEAVAGGLRGHGSVRLVEPIWTPE